MKDKNKESDREEKRRGKGMGRGEERLEEATAERWPSSACRGRLSVASHNKRPFTRPEGSVRIAEPHAAHLSKCCVRVAIRLQFEMNSGELEKRNDFNPYDQM